MSDKSQVNLRELMQEKIQTYGALHGTLSCEASDVFHRYIALPIVEKRDLVAFPYCDAVLQELFKGCFEIGVLAMTIEWARQGGKRGGS